MKTDDSRLLHCLVEDIEKSPFSASLYKMPGYDTAVRGGLRLKRQSEALVADEKRRKKKKRSRENREEDERPTVVDLPSELANDPRAVAASAALEAGKALESVDTKATEAKEAQSDSDARNEAESSTSSDATVEKGRSGSRSVSVEQTRQREAGTSCFFVRVRRFTTSFPPTLRLSSSRAASSRSRCGGVAGGDESSLDSSRTCFFSCPEGQGG